VLGVAIEVCQLPLVQVVIHEGIHARGVVCCVPCAHDGLHLLLLAVHVAVLQFSKGATLCVGVESDGEAGAEGEGVPCTHNTRKHAHTDTRRHT